MHIQITALIDIYMRKRNGLSENLKSRKFDPRNQDSILEKSAMYAFVKSKQILLNRTKHNLNRAELMESISLAKIGLMGATVRIQMKSAGTRAESKIRALEHADYAARRQAAMAHVQFGHIPVTAQYYYVMAQVLRNKGWYREALVSLQRSVIESELAVMLETAT